MVGLNERLENIERLMEEVKDGKKKKREKPFKLPFGKKVNKAQKKKNYVTIMKINENGGVDFQKTRIEEQAFVEEGIPRLGTADYILHWKGNPMVILPSWSVKPFSPVEQYEKSMLDGSNTKGYKILMAKMYSTQTSSKKEVGNIVKWILGAGLLLIIAYAFIG